MLKQNLLGTIKSALHVMFVFLSSLNIYNCFAFFSADSGASKPIMSMVMIVSAIAIAMSSWF